MELRGRDLFDASNECDAPLFLTVGPAIESRCGYGAPDDAVLACTLLRPLVVVCGAVVKLLPRAMPPALFWIVRTGVFAPLSVYCAVHLPS